MNKRAGRFWRVRRAPKNYGLGTTLFAELAAGAGVRAYGVPSNAGGLPTNMYWRTAAKNGPMREFAGIMGLIANRRVQQHAVRSHHDRRLMRTSGLATKFLGGIVPDFDLLLCLTSTARQRHPPPACPHHTPVFLCVFEFAELGKHLGFPDDGASYRSALLGL